ncbi:DgyrCDS1803 [Dimorphilus gyrociliatus]|uniref:Endoplasmic reticulum-Golgi intermediate compartment protein 3 n=1 Tax=Dimorphilus gyrociliatus TaxID=2664684 RepID=A0A7I8VA84_9ANNE|nr:DgyrCDS1803 [Dimorphilus gyrociliatus]
MQTGSVFDFLKKFDAYPKTLEDFRIKTFYGAIITIVSGIFMFGLFVSELSYYLSVEVHSELLVDATLDQKVKINFDITFPKTGCDYLSMDAIDVSGEQQLGVDHDIYKERLDSSGAPLNSVPEKEEIGKTVETAETTTTPPPILDPNRCESCYGAESAQFKCCNTCDQVRQAYKLKGWALSNPQSIEQCKREGFSDTITVTQKEGCRVYGVLKVNKVAGNFHIAPGRSFQQHHVHVHDMQGLAGQQFNVTHRIRHLSFGDEYPGIVNPLDETEQIADQSAVMFQYYVKVVPTTYVEVSGKEVKTNQFSVTKHRKFPNLGEQALPGVFIIYELSPMMVKHTEKARSFMHFLTSVCAIVGGVFTVAGLLDSAVYNSGKIIHKFQIGKLS